MKHFTWSNLAELGLTEHELRTRLAEGRTRRVFRGVYTDAAVPDTIDARLEALRLVVHPRHVIIDRTAAWLHGADAFSAEELAAGARVETCALPEDHPSERAEVSGHTRALAPRDITLLGDVRVTSPLRTALDLGCHLRRREAYAAMCELARIHELTRAALCGELSRFAGRRGVVQLRELAPLVDPRFESPREAWTFLALHDAGLPRPEPQFWIAIDGVPTYRLDLAYPLARVCVEYDGHDAHSSDAQRLHDERRRAWLRARGWTVIVVRSGDFTGLALERWLGEVREALAVPYTTRRW